jgi:hypothetical protein
MARTETPNTTASAYTFKSALASRARSAKLVLRCFDDGNAILAHHPCAPDSRVLAGRETALRGGHQSCPIENGRSVAESRSGGGVSAIHTAYVDSLARDQQDGALIAIGEHPLGSDLSAIIDKSRLRQCQSRIGRNKSV